MNAFEYQAQQRAAWISGLHALADALADDASLPAPGTALGVMACVYGRYAEDGTHEKLGTAEKFAILRELASRYGAEVTEKVDGQRNVELRFGALRFDVFADPETRPAPAPSRVVAADEDEALIGGAR